MIENLILQLETEEEYQTALDRLTTWMADGDVEAPPYVESLIQAIVRYEEKHFPMVWEDEAP